MSYRAAPSFPELFPTVEANRVPLPVTVPIGPEKVRKTGPARLLSHDFAPCCLQVVLVVVSLTLHPVLIPQVPTCSVKDHDLRSLLFLDRDWEQSLLERHRLSHHTRGSGRSRRYAAPVAAASSRSSWAPKGNVVSSSNSSCCPGWTCQGVRPWSRKAPFCTGTLRA